MLVADSEVTGERVDRGTSPGQPVDSHWPLKEQQQDTHARAPSPSAEPPSTAPSRIPKRVTIRSVPVSHAYDSHDSAEPRPTPSSKATDPQPTVQFDPGASVPSIVVTEMASLNNTSVNIANAFRAATTGTGGGLVKATRREDFPPLDAPGAGVSGGGSATKKRKKSIVRDPTFKHRQGETETSESQSEDHETVAYDKKGKKRVKVRAEDDRSGLPADDRSSVAKHPSPRKPRRSIATRDSRAADPSFQPHTTTSASSDSEADDIRRRRSRSKSKGTGPSDAIPRGIMDGQVWHGKGKKKRHSRGKSETPRSTEPPEDAEAPLDREEDEEDLEGYENDIFNEQDDDSRHSQEPIEQSPPVPASGGLVSYFLRRKSPSPTESPQAAANAARATSTSLRALSPFKNPFSRKPSAEPSPDPAFEAFDRSLRQPSTQQSDSLESIEDMSHLRNSSYDYGEEERLVQAYEAAQAERRKTQETQTQTPLHRPVMATPRAIAQLQQQEQRSTQPQTPAGFTPRPKSGAYPLTPGTPVSNHNDNTGRSFQLRGRNTFVPNGGGKNRLPAPPSMLGQTSPGQDHLDQSSFMEGDEEHTGKWGRLCGSAVRPLVEMVTRVRRKLQDPLLDWHKILKALAGALGVVVLLFAIRFADSTSNASLPSLTSPGTSNYNPPTIPPDSLDALVARLSSLESAVGKIPTSSSDRGGMDQLAQRFKSLEHGMEGQLRSTKAEMARLDRDSTTTAKAIEGTISGVRSDLERLSKKLQDLATMQDGASGRIAHLETGFEASAKTIQALNSRLDQVSKDFASQFNSDRITQLALAAIEKKLPGKIGVKLDPSGRLEIDPTFWKHLKDAFVDKKELARVVENKVKALESKKPTSGGGLFGSRDKKEQIAVAPAPTWDDFLASNEDSLKHWIASDLEARTGGDAFVSKKTFLDLLHREIKLLKRDFENKANENFEQMGQELLAKVAKQDEMRKKDAAYSQRYQSSQSNAGSDRPVTIKSLDGQNVTAVISSLVDSALLRYSKDVLARPDYALFTAGGRVIRSLTSETYEPHPLSKSRAALAWVTGATAPRGRPAVTALHPDTAPGSCWPFEGQQGQIGIQLSRRVVPTDITVEHISRDVALEGDVSSAPKNFEVWAVVQGQEHVSKLAQYRHEQIEIKRSSATRTSLEDALNEEEPASLPPSPNHLLLAVGAYDTTSISPIQTFPVTSMARQLAIPVQTVVVKVLSNHGEPSYTCLYRIRVSGSTTQQLD
ncbi:uncharacterized protein JCM15063_001195 [Sporobolomyces koalae]|uniref:uncharacterized protein n=1 Tax=Sporobolomyces koalae TaxID=500713 RepID=UPI00317C1281